MPRQLKLILANAVLAAVFVAFNLAIIFYDAGNHAVRWSTLWLTIYNEEAAATIGDVGAQIINLNFYLFMTAIIVNLYFAFQIRKSRRSRNTLTQNSQTL